MDDTPTRNVSISFPNESSKQATDAVLITLHDESCEGTVRYSDYAKRDRFAMAFPNLPPGQYAIRARAVSDTCTVTASACQLIKVPDSSPIGITLIDEASTPCTDAECSLVGCGAGTDGAQPDAPSSCGCSAADRALVEHGFPAGDAISFYADEATRSPAVPLNVTSVVSVDESAPGFDLNPATLSIGRSELAPALNAVETANQLSFELWFASRSEGGVFFSCDDKNNSSMWLEVKGSATGQLSVSLNPNLTDASSTDRRQADVSAVLADARVHQVVVTYDGESSIEHIYVDGSLARAPVDHAGVGLQLQLFERMSTGCRFGQGWVGSEIASGRLQRFAMYDRVLSECDVKAAACALEARDFPAVE